MKKDLISITDFTKDEYLRIMELAANFEAQPNQDLLKGKVVASLFFEPSTDCYCFPFNFLVFWFW